MAERDDRDEEIKALRSDLDTLRGLVTSLDAEIRRAQGSVDLTMKKQLRCRACAGQKIGHAPHVLDRGESDSRESMALYKPSWFYGGTQGELETYVCLSCGLVEWWVKDPGALQPHEKFFLILDGEVRGGKDPYRD